MSSVAADVGATEEVEQVGEDRRDARPAGHATMAMRSGVACSWWVTSSPDMISGPPYPNTIGGGLRVGPDVELGDGSAVAERAAAHQRDAGDAPRQVGRGAQREGDVGQRPGRHQPRPLVGAARLDDEPDGVGARRRPGRLGQRRPVEPALAVDVAGVLRLGDERALGAGVHRRRRGRAGRARRWRCASWPSSGALPATVVIPSRSVWRAATTMRDGVVVAGVAVEDDRQERRAT